jgi:hypothetical protein
LIGGVDFAEKGSTVADNWRGDGYFPLVENRMCAEDCCGGGWIGQGMNKLSEQGRGRVALLERDGPLRAVGECAHQILGCYGECLSRIPAIQAEFGGYTK